MRRSERERERESDRQKERKRGKNKEICIFNKGLQRTKLLTLRTLNTNMERSDKYNI